MELAYIGERLALVAFPSFTEVCCESRSVLGAKTRTQNSVHVIVVKAADEPALFTT